MTDEPQRFQLLKSKRDAVLDLTSLAVFAGMVYYALNPDAFESAAHRATEKLNKLRHRVSIWQTQLSIRSLPETDDDTS